MVMVGIPIWDMATTVLERGLLIPKLMPTLSDKFMLVRPMVAFLLVLTMAMVLCLVLVLLATVMLLKSSRLFPSSLLCMLPTPHPLLPTLATLDTPSALMELFTENNFLSTRLPNILIRSLGIRETGAELLLTC